MTEALNKAAILRFTDCTRVILNKLHLLTEWHRLFSPDNSIAFLFLQPSPEKKNRGKSLISTAYLTNIRLRRRFPRDVHSSPSWHKRSDFEYRHWSDALRSQCAHRLVAAGINILLIIIFSKFKLSLFFIKLVHPQRFDNTDNVTTQYNRCK